jgi:hypothetical protein
VARVRELYPPSTEMRAKIETDRRIYLSAVAAITRSNQNLNPVWIREFSSFPGSGFLAVSAALWTLVVPQCHYGVHSHRAPHWKQAAKSRHQQQNHWRGRKRRCVIR